MPQDFVAAAIFKSIRALPGYPNLKVLDLSCGRGEILSALTGDGCTTRGTHYRSDDYKLTTQFTPPMTGGLTVDEAIAHGIDTVDIWRAVHADLQLPAADR